MIKVLTYRRMSDHRLYVMRQDHNQIFGATMWVCPYLERKTKPETEWQRVNPRTFEDEFKPANFKYMKVTF